MHRRLFITAVAAVLAGSAVAADAPLKIGKVTWHANKFVGKRVTLTGYLLAIREGYVYFSDEATGKIGPHDLAVTGEGMATLVAQKRYVLTGDFLDSGLSPDNGSKYHLQLTAPPAAQ